MTRIGIALTVLLGMSFAGPVFAAPVFQVAAQDNVAWEAKRAARSALYRFDELNEDWDRAFNEQERAQIEAQMMTTMGEALDFIHRTVSPRHGPESERIYRIAEPAYNKAWLKRYEWKQETNPERKRQKLNDLIGLLRQTLRDVRSVTSSSR